MKALQCDAERILACGVWLAGWYAVGRVEGCMAGDEVG